MEGALPELSPELELRLSPEPGPELSVVIPTHDRRESLLRTLEALTVQTLAPHRFEVVVALDAVSDGTEAALATRSWPFALATTAVVARNAAATRNAGAALARAPRIVFLDDDIRVLPGFLAAHLDASGPDRVVVGRSTPDVLGQGWFHDGLRGWWTRHFAAMATPGHRFGQTDVTSGNLSMPRALFERLAGFDARLGCREDYELGHRAILAGASIAYADAAEGLHRDESDPQRNLRRARAEGIADVAIARQHPALFLTMRATGLGAAAPSSQALRLVTFQAPSLVAPLLAACGPVLRLLEGLRLRRAWDELGRWRWGLAYHSGVAAAAGSVEALRDLEERAQAAWAPRRLNLDLCDGLDAARAALDAARPDQCTIRVGWRRLGELSSWPGQELLGRRHLDAWLRDNAWSWAPHVAAAELLPPAPAGGDIMPPEVGPAWSVGAVDLSDWTLRPARRVAALPFVALLRWGEANLGWVRLDAEMAKDGAWPALRRAALSDRAICEGLLRAALAPLPAPGPGDCPPISVVVCTRDRTDSLAECLEALLALDYPAFEILVVDNAPTSDATARLVAALPRVAYLREDRPGLDWARNRGMAAARHAIVAFTDDDTRADPGWLTGLARAFADPAVAAVTGLVAPMEFATPAQQYFELIYGGMGKGLRPRRWSLAMDGPRGILWSSGCGVGANMAFRREALARVGGFDPALDVGTATRGGGDIEMFHRLLARGLELHYTPEAMVWHRHRTDWDGLGRQMSDNCSGFAAYLMAAWRGRTVPRHLILRFAARDWIGGWLLGRLRRPGRHWRVLTLREVGGLLRAPGRVRRARRQAEELAARPAGPGEAPGTARVCAAP